MNPKTPFPFQSEKLYRKHVPVMSEAETDYTIHFFNRKFKPGSPSYLRATDEFGLTVPNHPATNKDLDEVLEFLDQYISRTGFII